MAKLPRLKKRREFVSVTQSKVSFKASTLILQMLARSSEFHDAVKLPSVRVGFTASRRVGGAVERNRARRRLREAVNMVVPQFNLRHYDLVVIARTAAVNAPFSVLLRDLTYAIKQCLGCYDH